RPSSNSTSSAVPTPDEIPSPVPSPSKGTYYWSIFMNRFAPLHKGFKTYRIFSPAGVGTCEFYVRLGRMPLTSRVFVVVYVPQSYCANAILSNTVNNYDQIVEELKQAVKNDGIIMFDHAV